MQTGEKLAVCPSGAVCSTSVSLAFPQGDDMDMADYAQALFNITSSGLVQVMQLLSAGDANAECATYPARHTAQ